MESMWNRFIPCGIHGIHMESTWNMFHHINYVLTDMESMLIPHGLIPHGFYMDSMWILCGFHVEYT
jgi:hypothetical protein